MIVPASGHQVRCIHWVQMDTFNKEIGYLCGLKFFALNIFGGEYLTLGSRFGFCLVSERIQASQCVADRPLAVLTGLAEPNPVTSSRKNKHGGRYLSHTHYKLLNLSVLEIFLVNEMFNF